MSNLFKVLCTSLIAFTCLAFTANASTNDVQKPQSIIELNECVLAIGFDQEQAEGQTQIANSKEIYCIKNTSASSCGLVMFDRDTNKFVEKPTGQVQVACAAGGFKKLLSHKVDGQKTIRDVLYDGPGSKGYKPTILNKTSLPTVDSFLRVYSDFHESSKPVRQPSIDPPAKTATNE